MRPNPSLKAPTRYGTRAWPRRRDCLFSASRPSPAASTVGLAQTLGLTKPTSRSSPRREHPPLQSETMANSVLLPMAAHVALAAFLYVLLTAARAPSVWGVGKALDGSNPWIKAERRISANLSNQFEWPLFFYAACLLVIELRVIDAIQVWLAWLFVAGRVAHSFVHISTTNVRLRGVVFTINFLAVLAMWVRLVLVQFGTAQ